MPQPSIADFSPSIVSSLHEENIFFSSLWPSAISYSHEVMPDVGLQIDKASLCHWMSILSALLLITAAHIRLLTCPNHVFPSPCATASIIYLQGAIIFRGRVFFSSRFRSVTCRAYVALLECRPPSWQRRIQRSPPLFPLGLLTVSRPLIPITRPAAYPETPPLPPLMRGRHPKDGCTALSALAPSPSRPTPPHLPSLRWSLSCASVCLTP